MSNSVEILNLLKPGCQIQSPWTTINFVSSVNAAVENERMYKNKNKKKGTKEYKRNGKKKKGIILRGIRKKDTERNDGGNEGKMKFILRVPKVVKKSMHEKV